MIAAGPAALDALAGCAPATLWLRPIGLARGAAAAALVAAGAARPLAGGSLAFTGLEALTLDRDALRRGAVSLGELLAWATARRDALAERALDQLTQLSATRPPWAGLALDRPLIMGILNVTPDSFSDGGDFLEPERAVAQGRALL